MKLTPAKRLWLERLRDKGPGHNHHGPTRFYCHQQGWTEWAYTDDATGEVISMDEARRRYPGPEFWDHVHDAGERITEAGRKILEESA